MPKAFPPLSSYVYSHTENYFLGMIIWKLSQSLEIYIPLFKLLWRFRGGGSQYAPSKGSQT